ncbi:MAG: hypothetical protein ACI4I9_05030 [Porcipelethomonas sp.]
MKRKKYRKTRKRTFFWYFTSTLVTVVVLGCGTAFAVTKVKCADMQKELSTVEKKTGELEAENVELQRILDDDDMNAYMEKIAIENMNYAYPNERRYYDTSRN